jgi:zinc transport system ATP-binding protein
VIDKGKNKIGFVPQKASLIDALFPATVEDIVAMGRTTKNKLFFKNSKEDKLAIEEALKKMDVYHLKDKMIGTLSGGQRQRVMCAKALASKPDVLILDEPNTGVDVESQKRFHSILKELNKDDKITIVFVTHDIKAIKDDVTRVFEIDTTLKIYDARDV